MTQQPVWKTVWQSDCTWLQVDETGEYEPEITVAQEDEGAKTFYVYRAVLDRYKEVRDEDQIYLVPFNYGNTIPGRFHGWKSPSMYVPWFYDDLESVGHSVGRTKREIIDDLCSDDPSRLANAHQDIGGYFGWDNYDGYPETMNTRQFHRYWSGKEKGPVEPFEFEAVCEERWD